MWSRGLGSRGLILPPLGSIRNRARRLLGVRVSVRVWNRARARARVRIRARVRVRVRVES